MENSTKFCTNCGQAMNVSERFCTNCGQDCGVTNQQMYNTANNANQQQAVYTTNNNVSEPQEHYATNPKTDVPESVYEAASAPVFTPEPVPEFVPGSSETISEFSEPVPKKVEKPKKKKGLLIGIIAAAVVVVVAGVLVLLKLFAGGDGDEYITPDGRKITIDGDTYILEMYPDAECNDSELQTMADIIQKRAEILGEDFTVSCGEGKILLTINEGMLGSSLEELSHNIKLLESNGSQALMMSGIYSSFEDFDRDDINSIEIETVDKDDFVKKYKKNFSKGNTASFKGIPAGDINVIHVTVTTELAAVVKEEAKDAEDYEEALVCATDCVKSSDYELLSQNKFADIIPISGKSGKEFYIVSPHAHSRANAELIVSVIENKGFERGLEVNLIAEPEWETESTTMGENQVGSLSGDAVTIEWTPSDYTLANMGTEEYDEYLVSVKKRIDALNTPYAIGYKGVDMRTIVLKVSPEKMSADFGRMIFGTTDMQLFTQFKDMDAYMSDIELIDNNGVPALQVEFSESKAELFESYSMTRSDAIDLAIDNIGKVDENAVVVDDGEAKPVYLVINDVNVASADLSAMSDDGKLIFENFLFAGEKKITNDDKDVLNMFVAAASDYVFLMMDSDEDMDIEIKHYNDNNEVEEDIVWGYDAKNSYDNDMVKKVNDLGYEMSFSPSKRNTAVIELDVAVDDSLATNFCAEVKKIYQECNFGDGTYASVIFKIKDETKKHPGDRCRIVFSKDSYDKVKLTYMDYVEGPSFSEYAYDFYEVLEEDEFYVDNERY